MLSAKRQPFSPGEDELNRLGLEEVASIIQISLKFAPGSPIDN